MKNQLRELARLIENFAHTEGVHSGVVQGVHCIRFSEADTMQRQHWRSSIAVVAQGGKEVRLGDESYRYGAGHYFATPVELPVMSRVYSAKPTEPFLCILVDLDVLLLQEIAAEIGGRGSTTSVRRGVFVGTTTSGLLRAALRLGELLERPEDASVLAPLYTRELAYFLLKTDEGEAIFDFLAGDSKAHRIARVIHEIRTDLARDFSIQELAQLASMSRAGLFQSFKDVTSMSPKQYQKRLRLLEARRLLVEHGMTAQGAALTVGYKSPHQFSREFSRMFGSPPKTHVSSTKTYPHKDKESATTHPLIEETTPPGGTL